MSPDPDVLVDCANDCSSLTVSFAHRMPNAGCHAPIQRVLAAAGLGIGREKPLPIPEPVRRPSALGQNDEQWMEERRMSLARIRQRKLARRKGVTFPVRPEPSSVECKSLPPVTDNSPSSQAGSPEQAGSDGEAASPTDTSNSHSQYSDEAIASVEDTDVETVSTGSQTLTESDSASDRTRTEVEPRKLQDKVALLDLGDLDMRLASMTVSS